MASEGQGRSPWGHKESDTTKQLYNTTVRYTQTLLFRG